MASLSHICLIIRKEIVLKESEFPTTLCNIFRVFALTPEELCAALNIPQIEDVKENNNNEEADNNEAGCSTPSDIPEIFEGSTAEEKGEAAQAPELSYFVSVDNELAVYQTFVKCCDHWLSQYSTTIEEDERFLSSKNSATNCSNNPSAVSSGLSKHNHRMVRLLLKEEKRAIAKLKQSFENLCEHVAANGVDWDRVSLLDLTVMQHNNQQPTNQQQHHHECA